MFLCIYLSYRNYKLNRRQQNYDFYKGVYENLPRAARQTVTKNRYPKP